MKLILFIALFMTCSINSSAQAQVYVEIQDTVITAYSETFTGVVTQNEETGNYWSEISRDSIGTDTVRMIRLYALRQIDSTNVQKVYLPYDQSSILGSSYNREDQPQPRGR